MGTEATILGDGQDKKAEEAEWRWEEKRKDEKNQVRRKRESGVPAPHETVDAFYKLHFYLELV